ncbi:MAG: hypothetical protein JJV94_02210 [Sulfurospirillum sp.]|nr:hypothetical protein [Sulfurospirillum sp.]
MSSVINIKTKYPAKFQALANQYEKEGNVEQQKRYENAIIQMQEEILPKMEQRAKYWAKVAGIPAGKFGQILSPEEVKFYEKDRSGGVAGFPDKLFPKELGLNQYI